MNKTGLNRQERRITIKNIVVIVVLTIILQFFPFYLQIVKSLTSYDFKPIAGHIYLWPHGINFSNYFDAIIDMGLLNGLMVTIIDAVIFVILSAIIVLIVGYVLGKINFRGNNFIFTCLLVTMIMPGEILMVSNYLLISKLNFTNHYVGLILPGVVNVSGILLMRAFMNTIPNSVLEAAEIDGLNELGKIFLIVFPMSMPVLAAYVITTFVARWNDYLWPLVVLSDESMYTLQLRLKYFDVQFGGEEAIIKLNAAMVISVIPVLIVYLSCQEKFISGMSISGLK